MMYWIGFVALWTIFWGGLYLLYRRYVRKQTESRCGRGRYTTRNLRTGEIRTFSTFTAYLEWYRHLTIEEMSEYSGWRYIED